MSHLILGFNSESIPILSLGDIPPIYHDPQDHLPWEGLTMGLDVGIPRPMQLEDFQWPWFEMILGTASSQRFRVCLGDDGGPGCWLL